MNNNETLPLGSPEPRTRLLRIATHIIVLAIIFVLPEVIMSWGRGVPRIAYLHTLVYVAIFYLNYALLIERLLFRQRTWAFVGVNVALVALFGVLMSVLHDFFFPGPPEMRMGNRIMHEAHLHNKLGGFIVRDCLMVVLSACLSVALKLSEKWMGWRMLEKQIEAEKREAELKNLKNQLNPHFLFNTLNSIYALIEISPAQAQSAVHRLSQMLRYMLYETPSTVTVRQETDFTRNYISLMELRMPGGTIECDIDIDSMADAPIAPLLFIPLVENAFKHGNTGRPEDKIKISIIARDGVVTCRTDNRFESNTSVSHRGGIGIANMRRRLLLLYGDDASLTTTVRHDRFTARMEIKKCLSINNTKP